MSLADAAGVDYASCDPIRTFPVYRGKPHHDGHHFFLPMGRHVVTESSLESQGLLWAEFCGATAAAGQPFKIVWPKGSTPQHHVPDFYLRDASGVVTVMDVRPPSKADDPAFAATAVLCDVLGFKYELFVGLPEPGRSNLSLISQYRHEDHAPENALWFKEAFDGGVTLGSGVRRLTKRGLTQPAALIGTYYLLWKRHLTFDLLGTPLNSEMEVRSA